MYTLDRNAAAKADAGQAQSFIKFSGIYTGKIKSCTLRQSPNGARLVGLHFVASDGADAKYLELCTHKNDGSEAFGLNMLHSLMWVCKVKALTPSLAADENGKQITVANELAGKPVIIAMQAEEYTSRGGQARTKMVIKGFFSAEDRKSASEQQGNLPANKIQEMEIWLKLNPLKEEYTKKPAKNQAHKTYAANSSASDYMPPQVDFDDSINF